MYSIDICVDAKRCSNENLDKFIRETAYELNCSNCYMTYETTDNKKPLNIHCIFNIEYDTEYYDSMKEFLKTLTVTKVVASLMFLFSVSGFIYMMAQIILEGIKYL